MAAAAGLRAGERAWDAGCCRAGLLGGIGPAMLVLHLFICGAVGLMFLQAAVLLARHDGQAFRRWAGWFTFGAASVTVLRSFLLGHERVLIVPEFGAALTDADGAMWLRSFLLMGTDRSRVV